jgi:hypothetical protein
MIKRFEDEYPETRLPVEPPTTHEIESLTDSIHTSDPHTSDTEPAAADPTASDDEDPTTLRPLSRHNSDVSLASRALAQEEGRMHRFGQQFRRDILKPQTEDHLHGTTGQEVWAPHLEMLRGMIEGLGGDELRKMVEEGGQEAIIKELGGEASVLRQKLMEQDPEGWEKFREAQEVAMRNGGMDGDGGDGHLEMKGHGHMEMKEHGLEGGDSSAVE